MSQEELSKEPPPESPKYPSQKELSIHDSDNELSTDPEGEAQCMREETHTKWHQEYGVGSIIRLGMEDQLQWLIKAVTDSSKAVT